MSTEDRGPEVLRDALRLMEDRERRLSALDASLARGLADLEAGRVHDADAPFDELDAELAALPDPALHEGRFFRLIAA